MKRTGALSTGTLSLKFMQRGAARTTGTSGEESTSSKPAVVELEKKKVYDEAEWDVGSAVRRAWGLSELALSSPLPCNITFIYIPRYHLSFSERQSRKDLSNTNHHTFHSFFPPSLPNSLHSLKMDDHQCRDVENSSLELNKCQTLHLRLSSQIRRRNATRRIP
jgi:hypothetical protein